MGLRGTGQTCRVHGRLVGCSGAKTRAWLAALKQMGPQKEVWACRWWGVDREGLSPKFPRLLSRVLTHISSMFTSPRSSTWARARCRNR